MTGFLPQRYWWDSFRDHCSFWPVNLSLPAKKGFFTEFINFLKEKKYLILTVEICSLPDLWPWAVVRAYAPDQSDGCGWREIHGNGFFLNGVLNSPHLPPLDPWLSGFAISYYYFGYIMMGMLTRFSRFRLG